MHGMRVTVFGGSGFVGRHLVRRLARAGATVTVAVRYPEGAQFLKPMGDVGQIAPVYASVTKPATIARAVEGADAVVNLVGVLHQSDQSFAAAHVAGARNVAQAAAQAGITNLVQMSAIGASAESEASYARTKATGETAVRDAVPTAVILRPSVVFGPEDNFLNQFGAMSRIAPALPLIGGGKTLFQPVFVGDVADAIMAAISREDAAGRTFELGGPRVMSFREILEFVVAQTGRFALLLPIPFGVAKAMGMILQFLPSPPLTLDQVRNLLNDNVVSDDADGFAALGITELEPIEAIAPAYLARFRKPGPARDSGGAADHVMD